MTASGAPAGPGAGMDPAELLRSRRYVGLLVLGAAVGVPVAVVAYFFLKVVGELQHFFFASLPGDLGFNSEPTWWPLPLLAVCGLLVALSIERLPGIGRAQARGGPQHRHDPPGRAARHLLAALATLSLGAVLGPEAPLIAIGTGLGVLAMRFVRRDAPQAARMVIGVAGSFAAISTLLGSPLVGAFLLMEAAGRRRPAARCRADPGPAGGGRGRAHLRRAWTRGPGSARSRSPFQTSRRSPRRPRRVPLGARHRRRRSGTRDRHPPVGACPAAVVDRAGSSLTPLLGLTIGGLAIVFDRGYRQGLVRRCSSPARTSSAAHPATPPGGRLGRSLCSSLCKASPTACR